MVGRLTLDQEVGVRVPAPQLPGLVAGSAAPHHEGVRLTLIALVLVAAAMTAATASAGTHGKACLQSHGFRVVDRPDLGAASVAASDWFVATRGVVQVDVAYFSNLFGATYARAVLAALAKTIGTKVTGLRQNGRVVYWSNVSPARYGSVVHSCLGG
jgi:hypothetical protein